MRSLKPIYTCRSFKNPSENEDLKPVPCEKLISRLMNNALFPGPAHYWNLGKGHPIPDIPDRSFLLTTVKIEFDVSLDLI
jgi:hypothetical protein